MTSPDSAALVKFAFAHLLHRDPRLDELDGWTTRLDEGMSELEFLRSVVGSREYNLRNAVVPGHPPGHFYSPIVNPQEAKPYWARSSSKTVKEIIGINIDVDLMIEFWQQNLKFMQSLEFSANAGGHTRYYHSDRRYPTGDALLLGAMLNVFRPRRVYEIGSGFSSAAMLDVADRINLDPFRLVCIDPYADRLRSLLRAEDLNRVSIVEKAVQEQPLSLFEEISSGDILFIDSSHILKTGSDVHYELFEILPRLKPGVVVHFHDIHFPFEYPKDWVLNKKWSWNEVYAVRAFLTYNERFEILFFNDLFFRSCASVVANTIPGFSTLNGGSLWLKVKLNYDNGPR